MCAQRLRDHEGGWQSGENDPGGETKFGLSRRSYPSLDFETLTWADAQEIYYRDFWRPLPTEQLPHSVSWALFDFAVHSGRSTAIRYLQRVLGVADDGIWGPISQGALDDVDEYDTTVHLIAERLSFMTRLQNWPHASRGWSRRIAQNLLYAIDDAEA